MARKKIAKQAPAKAVKKSVKKSAKAASKSRPKAASPPAGAVAAGRSTAVDAFMAASDNPFKKEVDFLRALILKADKRIGEQVKWKAPSYSYKGLDMGAFNLWNRDLVHFVFLLPEGRQVADPGGILEGDYHHRRMIYFKDMKQAKAKQKALTAVVKDWVKVVDRL